MRTTCCQYNYSIMQGIHLGEFSRRQDIHQSEGKEGEEKMTGVKGFYLCLKCFEPAQIELGAPIIESCKITLEELLEDPRYTDLRNARSVYLRTLRNYGIIPQKPLKEQCLEQLTSEEFVVDRINLHLATELTKKDTGETKGLKREPNKVAGFESKLNKKIARLDNLCALITAPYYGNPNKLPLTLITEVLKEAYSPVMMNFCKASAIHWLSFILGMPAEVKVNRHFLIRVLVSIIFGGEKTVEGYSDRCFWHRIKKDPMKKTLWRQLILNLRRHLSELVNPAVKPIHNKIRLSQVVRKRRKIIGKYSAAIGGVQFPLEDQHGNTEQTLGASRLGLSRKLEKILTEAEAELKLEASFPKGVVKKEEEEK